MARDLNDSGGWIQQLIRRVARLESGAMLERSSITNGRMRFIGGLLRLDSGALLELVGQWRFFGPGAITGDVYSEGKWTQVGDYDFTGNGDLAGDVTMSGDFDLTGIFKSGNVRIEGGKIYVGAGPVTIVIDGATGKITAGNVTVESNKVTIGGADGNTVLTNSQVQFANGGIVATDSSGGISMRVGNARARVADGVVQMTIGTRSIVINGTGISAGLPTTPLSSWPGRQVGDVVSNTSGDLFRVV
ncbi:hypothetical protein [uncultured Microbacterium sp.]|uniref:hypothetical protein n=1 Tax=uncultured Microbacterium sp. TaxID=191216 RepID=UPI0025D3B481|nr:hypothetical protein [uncultured Microbacterium sp.]